MSLIDVPRLGPKSGHAKKLVILFHGYGSNGHDLIGLAQAWAPLLSDDIAWVSPNAPQNVPGAPNGYQWFPISSMDLNAMTAGARSAHVSTESFCYSELQRWGLRECDLVLVGFSQGTMMALHTGLRFKTSPAGILGFSGALPAPESLKTEMVCKPPIFLIHGDADDVLPVDMTFLAAQSLSGAGHGAQFHISQGVPHSIGQDGLELGGRFIKSAFEGHFC